MTFNLKKALLAGTAIVAVGAFAATTASAATLAVTADVTLDDGTAGTDVATLDTTSNPIVSINNAAVIVGADITDATANDDVFSFITAGESSLTVNAGSTVTAAGTGDVVLTADLAGITVNVAGALAASAATENAINFAALGAGNAGTINITGGAGTDGNVTGLITGGAGDDALNIDTTAGGSTITGIVDLGGGADTLTITGSTSNPVAFTANVSADTITLNGGAKATFGGDVAGNIGLNTSSIVEVAAGENITGTVDNVSGSDNAGELILAGATTVSGVVGGTNSLAVVAIGNGTGTFSETVNANIIDFDAAGTAAFAKSVTATTLSFDGYDGTVTLADTANFTGNIDNSFPTGGTSAAATNVGTLTVSGDSTITGNVGATNALKEINVGATGKTATFTGTVAATTINVTADGTADLQGATTATALTYAGDGAVTLGATSAIATTDFNDNDGTLNISDNANLTGDIVDTSDAKGTVNFAGSSAVTGSVGTAGNSLAAINFNGGAGETVSVSGTIIGTDIKIAGAGTVNAADAITGAVDFDAAGTLNVADTVAITGAVGVSTADQGIVNFAGAGSMSSTLNAGGFELAELNLEGSAKTVTAGGNVIAANKTVIGDNTLAVTGTFVSEADDALSFTVADATTVGQITATSTATIDADTAVEVKVATTDFIADATSFTLVDGTGGGGVADLNAGKLTFDSALITFEQDVANDDDLVVIASRADIATVTPSANVAALNAVLLADAGADADLAPIQSYFQTASTAEELEQRTEAASATVDGGFVVAGTQSVNLSTGVTNDRIELARNGGSDTGMVAGQMGEGMTVWGKAFGQMAEQDLRDGVSGYDVDTFGVAVGVDTENMIQNGLVGVSFSYAMSDVESENLTTTNTDVDSYQLSLYASKNLSDDTYVSGLIGYAMNNIEQTRNNVLGSGNTANADFDSDQFTAYAEFGRDYAMNGNMTLTPKVLANYQHLSFDGYTETGTSGGNLTVSNDDMDIFELGLGVNAAWDMQDRMGNSITPSLSAEYRFDTIGDEVAATSTFTGGGASFQTEGAEAAKSTFTLGAGVAYEMDDNWTVSADYGYQFKEDYDAHNVSVRAGFQF